MDRPTNLRFLPSSRMRPSPLAGIALAHADHPLEQRVRSANPKPLRALLAETSSNDADDGVIVVGDRDGLRLLARSEDALESFRALLANRLGDDVELDPPSVRIAAGRPALEPWMSVTVRAAGRCLPRVRIDFQGRGGRVERLQLGAAFVLEGEAPLAQLLGYARWLAAVAPGGNAALTLSRYRPLADGGPGAA